MSVTRSLRFRSFVAAGLAAVLAVGGCSVGNDADDAPVTVTERVQASDAQPAGQPTTAAEGSGSDATDGEAPGITVVAPPGSEQDAGSEGTADAEEDGNTSQDGEAGTVEGSTDPSDTGTAEASSEPTGEATGTTEAPPTTTAEPKPEPKPKKVTQIFPSPGKGATNVSPRQKISVTAEGGTLLWVKVVNAERKKTVGGGTVNAKSWTWKTPKLGWDTEYIIRVASKSTDGVIRTTDTSFTTMQPKKTVRASISPANGREVGVGHPIIIRFTEKIDDKYRRDVEKMIQIDRAGGQGAQPGAFRWFSQTELHWRPKSFWQANKKVRVSLDIYGARMSSGLYGARDVSTSFNVGRRITSTVDAKTHTMEVFEDFKLIKTIPVSLGTDKYPTYNGTHLVTAKHREYVMDSSTWGLKGAGAYRTKVKWATRISNSGEFIHGAPWSEFAQGNSNVSHGCINMTDGNAQWFYAISLPGDPVTVRNSSGKQLDIYDGLGDWAVPFDKY